MNIKYIKIILPQSFNTINGLRYGSLQLPQKPPDRSITKISSSIFILANRQHLVVL